MNSAICPALSLFALGPPRLASHENREMPRTRADAVVGGGKSSKKSAPAPSVASSSTAGGSKRKSTDLGGANPVVVRPTPTWQKGLGNFFKKKTVEEDSRDMSVKENVDPSESKLEKETREVMKDNEENQDKEGETEEKATEKKEAKKKSTEA